MSDWLRDVLGALGRWRHAPLVTAVAVVSLALGIGVNLAMFALATAIHATPLPVPSPERLVRVVVERGDYTLQNVVWEYFRRSQPVFARVAGAAPARVNLARDGESRFVQALYVSGEFFDTIGVPLTRGRGLTDTDDRAGAAPVAVVSHAFWQRHLGGREDVLGSTVDVARTRVTIVGVTAPSFFGVEVGQRSDVYLPAAIEPLLAGENSRAANPASHWLVAFARLREGQTAAQAASALGAWQPALRAATVPPEVPARQHLTETFGLVSAATGMSQLRRDFGRPILLLLGAVGLVLLVACANVAAMLLARFTDRQRELGVRLALGATRWRIVRALLIETLLLTGSGAVVGTGLAVWLARAAIPALATPLDRGVTPYLALPLDTRLLAAAIGLSLLTGLVAGLLPALRAARMASAGAVTSGVRGPLGSPTAARALRGLVAVQIAVALVLVSAAGLLGRSFAELMGQPTAVDGDHVLLASLEGPLWDANPTATLARIDDLIARLESVPGVEAASASTLTPLSGFIMLTPVSAPFFATDDPRDANTAANRVTPRFFRTFGTPLVAGRGFDERDGPDAPRVAIVNTAFAEHYMRDVDDVVGRVIEVRGQPTEIVGVVATGRYMRLRDPRRQFLYLPLAQWVGAQPQPVRFAIRTADPDALRGAVVHAVRDFDTSLTVEFRTLADEIASGGARDRLLATLGALFATVALLMAGLGLHGTFAYLVTRRRAEIGVRMALGASGADVLRLVLRDAAGVLAAGLTAGVAGTLATGRYLEAVLYDVAPADPVVLAMGVLTVVGAGVLASALPGRSAARVDPAEALRAE